MSDRSPARVRLADAARVAGKLHPEDHVWHLVMHRAGEPPARGERLATLALTPAQVAALGARELIAGGLVPAAADAETVGLRVIARALDAERRTWLRRLLAAGYTDGWGVGLVTERGYHRSLFPGVGLGALAGARTALVLPGGKSA